MTTSNELTGHQVNGVNDGLKIFVADGRGQGGANHRYVIHGFRYDENPSGDQVGELDRCVILFQNGPLKESTPNGLTHEALLVILIHRLQGFQDGPFKCRENAIALTHLEEALMWLQKRTRARLDRGVEDTNQV